MKKSIRTCIWFSGFAIGLANLFIGGDFLSAQDTLTHYKALRFPARKYGLCIGNSYEFNGIRLNFADKNVKRVNGLNFTLWIKKYPNKYPKVNGISVGVIPTGTSMQPLTLGLLGVLSTTPGNMNGLSVGGIFTGAGGKINGITIGGLFAVGHCKVNGISLSSLAVYYEDPNSVLSGIVASGLLVYVQNSINGVSLGGLVVISNKVNGLSFCMANISCRHIFNGVGITPGYIRVSNYTGVAFAGYANTGQMNGLSVALFNRTRELHGVQFGLLNYAGNNTGLLKLLPVFNIHLRKNLS